MNFNLKVYHANISEEEALSDLRNVSKTLKKTSFTIEEYGKHGKFSDSAIRTKFGSWEVALNKAGLNYSRKIISNDELIDDLLKTAHKLKVDTLSKKEYDLHGNYDANTISVRFDGWNKALILAGLEIYRDTNISDELLMQNILNVWVKLGKQPTFRQMCEPLSKYSTGPYTNKYGTWMAALKRFIEWANDDDKKIGVQLDVGVENVDNIVNLEPESITKKLSTSNLPKRTSRVPSLGLRWKIFQKYNFTCTVCGASPAKNGGKTILHVDHVKPWSKGGETVLENLQLLCSDCNLGKSDSE
jgi:hypothetical protein